MEKTASREEMIRDMKAMASGDKSTLPLVQAALDSTPRMVDTYGDLAAQAEESLIRLVAGKNLQRRGSVDGGLLAATAGRSTAALSLCREALAQIRRLLVPMVQVNVAQQQVVANAVVAAAPR